MDSSSVVWENKDGSGGEKLKKITLNTLDKTFLLIGNICSQFCGEKPLVRVGKIGSKTLLISCRKQPPNAPFYRARKTSRWGLTELSVDRPVDRPTIIFQTVVPSVDRPRPGYREQVSLSGRPLGRPGPFQRAELSRRSTGSVDRPPARTGVHVCARRSTNPVDRLKPGQKTVKGFKTWSFWLK